MLVSHLSHALEHQPQTPTNVYENLPSSAAAVCGGAGPSLLRGFWVFSGSFLVILHPAFLYLAPPHQYPHRHSRVLFRRPGLAPSTQLPLHLAPPSRLAALIIKKPTTCILRTTARTLFFAIIFTYYISRSPVTSLLPRPPSRLLPPFPLGFLGVYKLFIGGH